MKKYKLLFVEENVNEIRNLADAIREFNGEHVDTHEITVVNAPTLNDAYEKLKEEDFNLSIVDLKLRGDTDHAEGNDIIKKIKNESRIPIIVYSDNLAKLDTELQNENDVYRIIERTSKPYSNLLDEIVKFLDTDITELFGAHGILINELDKILQQLFWKHIAHNWQLICKDVNSIDERKKIINRHLGSVLFESLSIKNDGFEKVHPVEVYYLPPTKEYYFCGDIIEKDGKRYIILNAACDMVLRGANVDAEYIVMAQLIPLKNKAEFFNYAMTQSEPNKNRVLPFIQNKKPRYHFLPIYDGMEGYLIDFENISISKSLDRNSLTRICSITESFMKNIIFRFSAFYARPGQPDFNNDYILESIKNIPTTQ